MFCVFHLTMCVVPCPCPENKDFSTNCSNFFQSKMLFGFCNGHSREQRLRRSRREVEGWCSRTTLLSSPSSPWLLHISHGGQEKGSRASSYIKSRIVASMVGLPCCPLPPRPCFYISGGKREEEGSRASSVIKSRMVASIFELPCCPPPPLPGFYITARGEGEGEEQDIQLHQK